MGIALLITENLFCMHMYIMSVSSYKFFMSAWRSSFLRYSRLYVGSFPFPLYYLCSCCVVNNHLRIRLRLKRGGCFRCPSSTMFCILSDL